MVAVERKPHASHAQLPSPPPPSPSQKARARRFAPEKGRHNAVGLSGIRPTETRAGLDGVPGLDGAPGLDGVPGRDGRNGRDGADGRDGKDGKDGAPGERGPSGPVGAPGEPGRRGKAGPPGKVGAPGPPGVCAYTAKYDCSLVADGDKTTALLVAPTMIGYETLPASSLADAERQVTVNEGDNIQLSCEASGQPRPSYIWRRSSGDGTDSSFDANPARASTTILFDVGANLRINSFAGGQMPLAKVDRLQAGGYECIASNGVPPDAVKRISLDINYAPTIRLHPPARVHRVQVGTSHLVECVVDANPSALTYWVFGSSLMMSIAPRAGRSEHASVFAEPEIGAESLGPNARQWAGSGDWPQSSALKWSLANKHIITESTGQLNTGASYTILTLNITNITRDDFGVYKCVAKNSLGQSTGHFILSELNATDHGGLRSTTKELPEKSGMVERLHADLGWPSFLLDRREAGYLTFGDEHRFRLGSKIEAGAGSNSVHQFPVKPFVDANSSERSPVDRSQAGESASIGESEPANANSDTHNGADSDHTTRSWHTPSSADENTEKLDTNLQVGKSTSTSTAPNLISRPHLDSVFDFNTDNDLCRVEFVRKPSAKQSAALDADDSGDHLNPGGSTQSSIDRKSILLLDQVGKPVYVGNYENRAEQINWWSLDVNIGLSGLASDKTVAAETGGDKGPNGSAEQQHHFYATVTGVTDRLFEYHTLADLLNDKHQALEGDSDGRHTHRLERAIFGHSHLISGGEFIYLSRADESKPATSPNDLLLGSCSISRQDKCRYFRFPPETLGKLLSRQTVAESSLDRVELVSDENGVWIIVPTIENKVSRPQKVFSGSYRNQSKTDETASNRSVDSLYQSSHARRLHLIKLHSINGGLGFSVGTSSGEHTESVKIGDGLPSTSYHEIDIEYHVSMRLDWQMVGHLFIVDGVLYGTRERHSYAGKMQFAYDLYKCRLLPPDYLNEPHRTITSHFGDIQMIRYNPNEPKRLYLVDRGNLLWCPVKLIRTNPNDTQR